MTSPGFKNSMPDPFVSVVVPVYNDFKRLKKCLDALNDQTYPKSRYEIIVVDDGSVEEDEILANQFSQVSFIREDHRGCYAARNKAIAVAKGGIIASTDSDCIPASDWLEKGVKSLLGVPNCGLVAGRIEIFFKDSNRPTAAELFESITAFRQKKYVERYKFGVGANLFTFKRVFEKVGLFDGPIYAADVEWGKRVFSAGYKQIYTDEARVAHPAKRSLKGLLCKHAGVIRDLHQIYNKKNQTLKSFIIDLKDDWPLFRDFISIWRDNRLKRNSQRSKVSLVMLLVKFVRISERIRLRLITILRRQVKLRKAL